MRAGDVAEPLGVLRERPDGLIRGTIFRFLTATLVVIMVVYVTWLIVGPHHPVNLRDEWLSDLLLVFASALAIARGLRGQSRVPWLVIGVGMSLWTVGDVIWTSWFQNVKIAPDVTIADGFYLAFYPCMWVGLVLLLRQRIDRFPFSVALDGILVALGVAAYGTLVVRAAAGVNEGLLSAAVSTAHPAGDVLLIVLILSMLTLLGWRGGWTWLCLAAGCCFFAAADTIYLIQGNNYQPGTILGAGWPVGLALLALSGWLPDRSKPVPFRWAAPLVLPSGVALTSVGFLVASSRTSLPFVGVVLAACALAAVLLRGMVSFREVSALAETRRQAHTDELTGLANRRRLYHQLDLLLNDPACPRFAVLLLDLDRFKEVNDALGHTVGDELLCQLGTQLSKQVRGADLVARLGGDEFALLLAPGSGANAAESAAKRTIELVKKPFALNDISLHVDASVGVALYPEHGDTNTELLRCADIAMYRAKRSRSGYAVYSAESDVYNRDRLLTIEQLRDGIVSGQLICYYQPEVDLSTGRVVAAEALVRWQHPTRGLLLPGEFLSLAEQTGLMREVFVEVLNQALGQCQLWQCSGHDVSVAVNLSVTNLLDVSLRDTVRDLLLEHELSPRALALEITEDVLLADPEGARVVLEELRALGSRASLDDYGTGYNSLAILQTLPVDELKIDRMFVTGIGTNPKGRAIVEATVTLARSLGLDLVAEGVESEADLNELVRFDVGIAQGFWLSRPQPPASFARWLDAHRATVLPPSTRFAATR